jgi:hypothetical protein
MITAIYPPQRIWRNQVRPSSSWRTWLSSMRNAAFNGDRTIAVRRRNRVVYLKPPHSEQRFLPAQGFGVLRSGKHDPSFHCCLSVGSPPPPKPTPSSPSTTKRPSPQASKTAAYVAKPKSDSKQLSPAYKNCASRSTRSRLRRWKSTPFQPRSKSKTKPSSSNCQTPWPSTQQHKRPLPIEEARPRASSSAKTFSTRRILPATG